MGHPTRIENNNRAEKTKINKRSLGIDDKRGRDANRYTCICCGETFITSSFYKSTGSIFWNTADRVAMVCKGCVKKLFEHYKEQFGERIAVICCCHILDIPYEPHTYESALMKLKNRDDFEFSKYILEIRGNKHTQIHNFSDSIANGEIVFAAKNGGTETGFGLDIPLEPEEVSTRTRKLSETSNTSAWTKEEIQNKKFVVSTVGYDPFANLELNTVDLKFLYNVMSSYCDTDGIQGDGHKLQAAVELSLTQLQSRKINEMIQKEMAKTIPNEGILKTLSETKKRFQEMISTIAEDNKFASNYNANSQPGKFTFTSKMKELAENDYEAIKVNLYDVKTSKAMKQIADISSRAILDQLAFDANDYTEMIKEQREMITRLQTERDYFEERMRLLNNEVEILKKGKKGR